MPWADEMDRAIPNQVRVIDLNGDGLADRMYASDLGGQIWRFDVSNGQSANSLIAGGVIAQLGADGVRHYAVRGADAPLLQCARRLAGNGSFSNRNVIMAISIGSGYRAHPFDDSASDQILFYPGPGRFQST